MTSTSTLKKITLHLARTKEYPEGSIRHGYDVIAPLDAEGRIDVAGWRSHRNACLVHRFWGNEQAIRGLLIHRAGGSKGATWAFDYHHGTNIDDETGYRLGDHVFAQGEYVSVHDAEDQMHTFRVVSVELL